ncbi:GNAT family N-acetyltransferase [Arthrobacter sp. NamB2]|uniref:GNAT family N-acetyltransferase n=1 Tax=Arthrobacter sp. NamB2 TaxID=2576035 RepID=UPI0010C9C981|nr:GNAT family N-acetyltransferase [Arthrobacter sp. NamB2]TKV28075.1 GNAT family N-acetyltransferase [Arthrobacter sp. NamB2]
MSDYTTPDLHTEIFSLDAEESATADGRFVKWLDAEGIGFHEGTFDPEDVPRYLAAYQADQRVLWGVHDRAQPAEALGADHPVATYGTMVHALNVGAAQLDVHQITAVTVRTSHRRNGILRSMMTRDLREAKERGLPLAILTASEATIYGRFGFGCATFTQSVEVDVRERFEVTAPRTGTTTLVAREHAVRLAEQVFAGFQASTFGSVDRQYAYPRRASGEWGRERPVEDRAVRMAVHYDAEGTPVGYVSYRFAGWETTPYTMKIVDLVAATPSAYLELWRYLGSLDLVQLVTWDGARRDDPLPWALRDRRCYQVKGTDDVLWVRMLDVQGALARRSYEGTGKIVLRVTDDLDIVGGCYVLTVVDGVAEEVAPVEAATAPDVTLTVNALGSLYLGGVSASVLRSAGALTAHDDAVGLLDALFGRAQEPYCITHF